MNRSPRAPQTLNRRAWTLVTVLAGLLGLSHLIGMGGWNALDFTNLNWTFEGDWSQHLLGWLFFRNADWSWPIGAISGLLYPIGTSVGYTDSNPWFALIAKGLSPVLPIDFQYMGLWLAICFTLQGLIGVAIARALGANPSSAILAALLFVLAPVLASRIGHDTLCAHWLILAGIWLNLGWVESLTATRRRLLLGIVLVAIASGTHPYLLVMIVAIVTAFPLRLWLLQKLVRPSVALIYVAGIIIVAASLLVALGYVGMGTTLGSPGFGHWSSDVLALINPTTHSALFEHGLGQKKGQYEGFAYLGLGGIFLALTSLALTLMSWRRLSRPFFFMAPLILVCSLMMIFSWSEVITWRGREVLNLTWLYSPFHKVITPFRSSGRFIWPMYYLILTGAIAVLLLVLQKRPRAATAILAAAACLQVTDVRKFWMKDWFIDHEVQLASPIWGLVRGDYKHVSVYPPHIDDAVPRCLGRRFKDEPLIPIALEAYRLQLTFNSGYVARLDGTTVEAACQKAIADIQAGRLRNDAIYVVTADYERKFRSSNPNAACGRPDHFLLCVTPTGTRFARALIGTTPATKAASQGASASRD